MVNLIQMSCGDAALVVNGEVVMTADPQFEDPSILENGAERLSVALKVGLHRVALEVPEEEDWSWQEVVESLLIGGQIKGMKP